MSVRPRQSRRPAPPPTAIAASADRPHPAVRCCGDGCPRVRGLASAFCDVCRRTVRQQVREALTGPVLREGRAA